MSRPLPMKFIPQTPIKVLRIEHAMNSQWMIWLTANSDFTLGTFIQLCDDGEVNRITWHEDGSESIFSMVDKT